MIFVVSVQHVSSPSEERPTCVRVQRYTSAKQVDLGRRVRVQLSEAELNVLDLLRDSTQDAFLESVKLIKAPCKRSVNG